MAAPTVQSFQDILNSIQPGYQPEEDQIDSEVQQNDQSGDAQTQGLNNAQTEAFGNIAQQANDRGATFSGFTPSQEATYTGSTYLPALAKLQSTIAATRNTLLGQKADIATTANTAAETELQNEQKALTDYNTQQDQNAFTANQNELDRQATAANTATSASATAAATKAALNARYQSLITTPGSQGKDTFVSPKTYNYLLQSYQQDGGNAADFKSAFSGYANPKQATLYGNTTNPYIGL